MSSSGLYSMPLNTAYDEATMAYADIGDSYTADSIEWTTGGPNDWPYGPTIAYWRISEDPRWVTPGPDRTGHSEWPGGNEYGNDGVTLVAGSSEVQAPVFSSNTIFYIDDGVRYSVDDPDGDLGYAGAVQGMFATGEATPYGPWQAPMDWLILFRTSSMAATSGWLILTHRMMDTDPGSDPAQMSGTPGQIPLSAAWGAEISVTLVWQQSGGNPAMTLTVYTADSGGVGILHAIEPDTSTDFTNGPVTFTNYGDWDHGWDKVLTNVLDIQPDTQYYLRVSETQVHNAAAGARRLRVKVWKATDPQPSTWDVDDVMPMYKIGAYTYLGHTNISGDADLGDSTYVSMFEFDITSSGGSPLMGVDAVWALTAEGFASTISGIPIYDNAEAQGASLYVTAYPYVPGSLRVWWQGTRLRPDFDYIESDPAAGEFRIVGDRDISGGLHVDYTRAGSVPNFSGGTVYRPAAQTQYGWGTPLDGHNCIFAASAMALDRHTLGAHTQFRGTPRNTPPNHRGFQTDQVGGGDIFDAATAWSNGWGETMVSPGITSWSDFVSKINAGRGAILLGIYSQIPETKRFSDFTGPHAIYINEQFANGNFWGLDPLSRYPMIYTTAELQAYAGAFAGPGLVSAGFTQVTS
jgi:hypothetical protein